MALKRKITKDEFDALSEELQKEYKENNGEYILDVEGAIDENEVASLRRAKEREAQQAKELREQKEELENRLAEIDNNDARKRGDIETLEKSWKEKYDKDTQELQQRLEQRDSHIKTVMRDNVASELARSISKSPRLMERYLRDRITVDFDGENPVTRILDEEGKPTALTVDDLKKEVVANPDFADIIVAGRGSGSADADTTDPSRARVPPQDKKSVDYMSMSGKELADAIAARKGT